MEIKGDQCWRLGIQELEDSETEEVILCIQGIVCNRDLPPIRSPFKVYVLISLLHYGIHELVTLFNDVSIIIRASVRPVTGFLTVDTGGVKRGDV